MSPQAFPKRYRVRVVDVIANKVVVSNLAHSDLDFELRGMQAGAPGQNLIGAFSISLWPPGSDEYRSAASDYQKLAINQRVEIFQGFGLGGGVGSTGAPVFSGIIRGLPRSLMDYKVTGVDSLQVLHQARTGRTEYFNDTTDKLAAFALRGYTLYFGDDFSGAFGSLGANWTANGAWTGNVSDEGLTTATISDTAADDYLLSNSHTPSYADCVIRCWFHILATTAIGSTTQVGLVAASDLAHNNLTEGQILLKCISATEWDIDVILNTKVAGTYTSPSVKRLNLVFNVPTNLFRCQLQLIGKKGTFANGTFTPSATGADYMWRLLVNGVDSNCFTIQLATSPSGYFGVHWNSATGGSPQLWASNFVFRARANLFAKDPAHFVAGSRKIAQYFSRVPNLDMLQQAAVVEQFAIRKRPQGFPNQDQIAFGPATASYGGVFRDFSVDASSQHGLLYQAVILTDSPTAYLPLDGNLNDIAGTGLHFGTWSGTPNYSADSPVTGNTNVFAGNGASHVTLASWSNLILAPTTTVEFWVKATDHNSTQILVYGYNTPACARIEISIDSGHLNASFGGCEAGSADVSYAMGGGDVSWHHFAAVFASSGTKLYRDGVLVATASTGPTESPFVPNDQAGIGGRTSDRIAQSGTKIAHVAVYPTLLTPAQILAHFQSALLGSPELVGPTLHLIEKDNLESASFEPLAESAASEVSLQLSPGSDNAGMIEWDNIGAEKQFGILTNAVNAQYVSDFLSARVLAGQLVKIAGTPGLAKRATVMLDGATTLLGSALLECGPGDYVSLTSPRLGISKARVQVVTLKFTESKATVDAVFDSYPLSSTEFQLRRLWQTIDALAAGVASLSPTTGSATVYDNAYGAPNVMTCYSGYWPVDATHNLQLKFAFPRNIVMIQRITLTFFLFAYLHGIQTTTASTTSAAGSSHSHGFSGQSTAATSHQHNLILGNGTAGAAVVYDSIASALMTSGGATLLNSTQADGSHTHDLSGVTSAVESTHTHSIPSVSLNSPTALQAGVGGATGIHVIVDGVDRTTALGGPWSTDTAELDLTPYVLGGGSHTVQLSSTALGGINAQLQAFTLAKSI